MLQRNYVSDVVEASETDDGLAITGRFDFDTEHGQAAYRNTKGRRVSGLSIGYTIRNSTNTAAGNERTELELIDSELNHHGLSAGPVRRDREVRADLDVVDVG